MISIRFKIIQIMKALTLSASTILCACNGESAISDNSSAHAIVKYTHISTPLDSRIISADADDNISQLHEYAYAANGHEIKMYQIDDGGTLNGELGTLALEAYESISAIAATPDAKFVYAAIKNSNNYKMLVLAIDELSGRLSILPDLTIPINDEVNSIMVSITSQFVYFTTPKQICSYAIESTSGRLVNPACASPTIDGKSSTPYWQVTLSADSKYAFVSSGQYQDTILSFKRESSTGALTYLSKLDTKAKYNKSWVTPTMNGKFLYSALKDNGAVGQYRIESSGKISFLQPQNISSEMEPCAVAATNNAKYVYAANYYSNSISMYHIESTTGLLSKLSPATIAVNSPYKIALDPMNNYLYVSTKKGSIVQYKIESTGLLTPLSPSSVTAPAVGQIVTVKLIRSHITAESPVDHAYGISTNTDFVIEVDNDVLESSIKFQILQSESNIGEIREFPDESQAVVATLTNAPKYTDITFAITMLSAGHYLLDPNKLDPGKLIMVEVDGTLRNGEAIHHNLEYTTKSEIPVIIYPANLHDVSVGAIFTVVYESIISETDVNDSTLYITRKGESAHIPANIIINACTDMFSCCFSWFSSCFSGKNSASIEAEETLLPGEDHEIHMVTSTGVTIIEARTGEEESDGLFIYVARNSENGYAANLAQHDLYWHPPRGVAGADEICRTDPNKPTTSLPGGSGIYKAMIFAQGGENQNEATVGIERYPCRISDTWWRRGGVVCGGDYAKDWVLFAGKKYITKLEMLIGYATDDNTLPNELVHPIEDHGHTIWTGANLNWTASADTCNSWTNNATNLFAMVGISSGTNVSMYNTVFQYPCNEIGFVYCAEQPTW